MKHITAPLQEQIKTMQQSFDAQKIAHSKDLAAISEKFEQTAKNMKEQTDSIGAKAGNLADALRGSNKLQGNWGERIIQDILDQEGLLEGRDYDKEEYLRDEKGDIVTNQDSGRRISTFLAYSLFILRLFYRYCYAVFAYIFASLCYHPVSTA